MQPLNEMSILIGKESEQNRLLIVVTGVGRTAFIGAPGSVPPSVSRCRAADGIAHAKIDVTSSGRIMITNLKPRNITFVNGVEIASKAISPTDSVELGKDHYRLNVPLVLDTARKLKESANVQKTPVGAPGEEKSVPKFNITHLERVWNERKSLYKIMQSKQKRTNLIRTLCGIFTLSAMIMIHFFGEIGIVCTVIGLLGNIYSLVALKNDDSQEKREQIEDEFQDNYVCPNPDCNKFLGNISYKLLKKQHSMHCPYCKCEYVER